MESFVSGSRMGLKQCLISGESVLCWWGGAGSVPAAAAHPGWNVGQAVMRPVAPAHLAHEVSLRERGRGDELHPDQLHHGRCRDNQGPGRF